MEWTKNSSEFLEDFVKDNSDEGDLVKIEPKETIISPDNSEKEKVKIEGVIEDFSSDAEKDYLTVRIGENFVLVPRSRELYVGNIYEFRDQVKNRDDLKLGVENGRGYEVEILDRKGREWLEEKVSKGSLRFDNPKRIESGHSYALILPEEVYEIGAFEIY